MSLFQFSVLALSIVSGDEITKDCGAFFGEEYTQCGSRCPLGCSSLIEPPRFCPLVCVEGCFCKTGLYRSRTGHCIPKLACIIENAIFDQCKSVSCLQPVCEEDEELYTPKFSCCPSCRKQIDSPIDCSATSCFVPECKFGEILFTPRDSCCPICKPIVLPPVPDCAAVLCFSECPDGSTPIPVPGECCGRCEPKDCDITQCREGCPDGEVAKDVGQCCPVCLPDSPDCSAVSCLKPECGLNQELVVPPNKCCPVCVDIELDCSAVSCLKPVCGDGSEPITPDGQCCPICDPNVKTKVCGGELREQCDEGEICVYRDTIDAKCAPACGGTNCQGFCISGSLRRTCGGFPGSPCPEGEKCYDNPDDTCSLACGIADCPGICGKPVFE